MSAYPVRLTLGDSSGIAKTIDLADLAAAENYATRYLGREWGDDREISVAQFFTLDPAGSWVFAGELEF